MEVTRVDKGDISKTLVDLVFCGWGVRGGFPIKKLSGYTGWQDCMLKHPTVRKSVASRTLRYHSRLLSNTLSAKTGTGQFASRMAANDPGVGSSIRLAPDSKAGPIAVKDLLPLIATDNDVVN